MQALRKQGRFHPESDIKHALIDGGRLGQKTGMGYYDYADGRTPTPSPAYRQVAAKVRAVVGKGGGRPSFSIEDLQQRLFFPLINEGFKVRRVHSQRSQRRYIRLHDRYTHREASAVTYGYMTVTLKEKPAPLHDRYIRLHSQRSQRCPPPPLRVTAGHCPPPPATARHCPPAHSCHFLSPPLPTTPHQVLEEGHAQRPSDIDVCYVHGYGFPRHRGGPMHHADVIGLPLVATRLRDLGIEPAALLQDCVAAEMPLATYWL